MPIARSLKGLGLTLLCLGATAAHAQTDTPAMTTAATSAVRSMIAIELGTMDVAERRVVTYECEGADPVTVEYINAQPNFLALVPIEGDTLVMAAVIAGSGARYVSGVWEWRTSGPDASLYDVREDDNAPAALTCFELNVAP